MGVGYQEMRNGKDGALPIVQTGTAIVEMLAISITLLYGCDLLFTTDNTTGREIWKGSDVWLSNCYGVSTRSRMLESPDESIWRLFCSGKQ